MPVAAKLAYHWLPCPLNAQILRKDASDLEKADAVPVSEEALKERMGPSLATCLSGRPRLNQGFNTIWSHCVGGLPGSEMHGQSTLSAPKVRV